MQVIVGIDLGTTYSAVAIVKDGQKDPEIIVTREGSKITPSIIQFIDGEPVFGYEAEDAFNSGEPYCISTFKRDMGKTTPYCKIDGREYTSEDLAAMLLKYLKEEAEAVLGSKIDEVVITVPAYFYSLEREATQNAAERAGLKVKKIIDEPNAAVMAYGQHHWRENAKILVFDLGGGTFDVTLTLMEKNGDLKSLATRGDHRLGGRDWDERLTLLLIDKFSEHFPDIADDAELKATISGQTEGVKKVLSSIQSTKVTVNRNTVTITRDEFENITKDLIERTGDLCLQVMQIANIKQEDLTDVLLVGGSTRMPQVKKYLASKLGKEPISHINPDEAVALGAAIQATKENQQYVTLAAFSTKVVQGKLVDNLKILDNQHHLKVHEAKKIDISALTLMETTAHPMGFIAISPEKTSYINDIIIPANHRRPVKVAKAFGFHTSSRGENEMEIFVLQGDYLNPLKNQIPYRYVVSGIRHIAEQRGQTTIRVQYSYDNNGIIHVSARQEKDNINLPIRRESIPEDMSKYGEPIDPSEYLQKEELSVILAIDVSGSMSGTPMDDAKNAMKEFVRQMDFSYTKVGIYAVANKTVPVQELTDDQYQCIRAIDGIDCNYLDAGYGNADHPFEMIMSKLQHKNGKRFAIILADGEWSCQKGAIESARRCNKEGIDTAAIGFGTANKQFLNDISNTEAQLVSQSELTQAFGKIAQSLGGGTSQNAGSDGTAANTETWDD